MDFKFKYLIIGLVIVVLGGIILLATHTWDPSWNPFKEEKRIIEKALENTFQAKTYRFEEKIELKTEKGKGISLELIGVVDQSDQKNIKTESSFKIGISIEEEVKLEGSGKLKTFKDIFYLKIDSLPPLPFLSEEILEGIKNQWIMIDIEQIIKKEEPGLSEVEENALLEEIKQLIKDKEFFEIKKRAPEKINDVKTTYYSTFLNKETIKETIPQILILAEKYAPEAQKEEIKKEIEIAIKDFKENFDIFWEKIISPLEVDFWLEKNLWVRKIKFEKEFDLAHLDFPFPLTQEKKQEKKIEEKLNIFFEVKFFDFNKEVEIEIVENYKTLEEVFSSLFMPFSPETQFLPETESFGTEFLPETEKEIPDFSPFPFPDFSP